MLRSAILYTLLASFVSCAQHQSPSVELVPVTIGSFKTTLAIPLSDLPHTHATPVTVVIALSPSLALTTLTVSPRSHETRQLHTTLVTVTVPTITIESPSRHRTKETPSPHLSTIIKTKEVPTVTLFPGGTGFSIVTRPETILETVTLPTVTVRGKHTTVETVSVPTVTINPKHKHKTTVVKTVTVPTVTVNAKSKTVVTETIPTVTVTSGSMVSAAGVGGSGKTRSRKHKTKGTKSTMQSGMESHSAAKSSSTHSASTTVTTTIKPAPNSSSPQSRGASATRASSNPGSGATTISPSVQAASTTPAPPAASGGAASFKRFPVALGGIAAGAAALAVF